MQVLISPADLETLMASEPVVVIDTRDPGAYAAGHIPGAVNLRDIFTYLATSDHDGLLALQHTFAEEFGSVGLSGAETAVIYEEAMNNGFGQSCRGYFLLKFLGYPKIKVLHGGFQAWRTEGKAVTTEVPTPVPATFPLAPDPAGVMVDKAAMLQALDDQDIIKLDVRDVDEWIGSSSSPYGVDFCPRKGRIPGAVWIEWYRMMKPGGEGAMFKARDEVLAELHTVGIKPDSKVYIYCFKGARASNTYLALKEAGVQDVKVYFGSWNEWSREADLPIESGFPS
ncbi:sulfurtransferase [Parasulfuritortus cantonensis]|uniref:Sulfurtransferase n=1 Tax=Parasulfuritortus cantonensis TaxID=2528202 RepID=A0A4R1B0X0_9PROT|nr:sulfurtransferase [Parasulfuritortus cantonensis]TCJ11642.1 sulfurtransferase [Parasulfuritortus cantonensis]